MLKLLSFKSKTCPPCRAQAPVNQQVKEETGVNFSVYDLDEHEAEFDKYAIRSIPTLIFLKNDVEILRKVGIVPKQTLIDLINENK